MDSDANDISPAPRAQFESLGQRGIDQRDLRARIQQEPVGAGMVHGDVHDHLVAVDKTDRYTGNIPWAMCFCGKRGDDGCGKNERSETPEFSHFECSSAGKAEGTLGACFYMVLNGS